MLRREEPRVARANFWLSEQALTTSLDSFALLWLNITFGLFYIYI